MQMCIILLTLDEEERQFLLIYYCNQITLLKTCSRSMSFEVTVPKLNQQYGLTNLIQS